MARMINLSDGFFLLHLSGRTGECATGWMISSGAGDDGGGEEYKPCRLYKFHAVH